MSKAQNIFLSPIDSITHSLILLRQMEETTMTRSQANIDRDKALEIPEVYANALAPYYRFGKHPCRQCGYDRIGPSGSTCKWCGATGKQRTTRS